MPEHASRLEDKNFRQQILQDYAPIIYLHQDTLAYPDTVKHVVASSELWVNNQLIFKRGQLNITKLQDWYKNYYHPNMQVVLKTHDYEGDNKRLNQVPCYAKIHEYVLDMAHTHEKVPVYALNIIMNYGANPGFDLHTLGPHGIGYHQGDIEHCTFYIKRGPNGKPGELIAALYAPHGDYQGQIVFGNDIPRQTGTQRPIIYPGLGSHGSYHLPGLQWRIFGFANDVTAFTDLSACYEAITLGNYPSSPGGIRWEPTLSDDVRYFLMHIYEGSTKPGHGLDDYKAYLEHPDSNVSSTFWTRFLALDQCYKAFTCCFEQPYKIAEPNPLLQNDIGTNASKGCSESQRPKASYLANT